MQMTERDGPFVEIFPGSKGCIKIFYCEVENVFRHVMSYT